MPSGYTNYSKLPTVIERKRLLISGSIYTHVCVYIYYISSRASAGFLICVVITYIHVYIYIQWASCLYKLCFDGSSCRKRLYGGTARSTRKQKKNLVEYFLIANLTPVSVGRAIRTRCSWPLTNIE